MSPLEPGEGGAAAGPPEEGAPLPRSPGLVPDIAFSFSGRAARLSTTMQHDHNRLNHEPELAGAAVYATLTQQASSAYYVASHSRPARQLCYNGRRSRTAYGARSMGRRTTIFSPLSSGRRIS